MSNQQHTPETLAKPIHQDQREAPTPTVEVDAEAPPVIPDLGGTSLETRATRVQRMPHGIQRRVLTQLGRTAGNRYVQQFAGAMQRSAQRPSVVPTTRSSQPSDPAYTPESEQATAGEAATHIPPTGADSANPAANNRASASSTTGAARAPEAQASVTQSAASDGATRGTDPQQRQAGQGANGTGPSSGGEVAVPRGKPNVVATTAGAETPAADSRPAAKTTQESAPAQKLPQIPKLPAKQERQEVPGAQELDQALDKDQDAAAESGDAPSPAGTKLGAEQERASSKSLTAAAKLQTADTDAAQLADMGIQFSLPQAEALPQEQTGQMVARTAAPGAADPTPMLERRRAEASKLASTFLGTAARQVQTITQLGQPIPARVTAMTERAKAAINTAMGQQRSSVAAQIAQQRNQAQREAQTTIAQIRNQHQSALAAILQSTANTRRQLTGDYNTARAAIDRQEQQQMTRINSLYQAADRAYRAAGVKVGREAIAQGAAAARGFESQLTGKDDSWTDGPLTDNRLKARAKAAREVAEQYNQGLIEEANKQASTGLQGKAQDIATVRATAAQARQTLAAQHAAALQSLTSAETQARSHVDQAHRSLTETANRTLRSTIQSLSQQEVAQLRLLTSYGQRQVTAVERDAHKAIAALQGGVKQAAAKLQGMLQQFQRDLNGTAAPDAMALSAVLAGANQQITSSVAGVKAQTERGVLASIQGIQRGSQQIVPALATMGQGAIREATTIRSGLTSTLTQLQRGAANTFGQVQRTHTSTLSQLSQSTKQGFTQLSSDIQAQFTQMGQNLEQGLANSAKGLETGLRGALRQLDADIKKYGDQAAAEVQPRWKGIVKILLIIAVIVVVAFVIGPAVLAGAGAIGTILGGAALGASASAVIQMGSNLIDGKNVLDGVGQAMIVGAIGGALGGAGGLLGNSLANAGRLGTGLSQSALKFGIDAVFDGVGGVLGDLAVGNPITLESILIGVGIGAAVSISVTGLGSIKNSIASPNVAAHGNRPIDPAATPRGNHGSPQPTVNGRGPVRDGVTAPESSNPRSARPEAEQPGIGSRGPEGSRGGPAPESSSPRSARPDADQQAVRPRQDSANTETTQGSNGRAADAQSTAGQGRPRPRLRVGKPRAQVRQSSSTSANQAAHGQATPGRATVLKSHRGGNQQLLINGQRWNLPKDIPESRIPTSDPVGDQLQEAVTAAAAQWSRGRLRPREAAAIKAARAKKQFWRVHLLERQARGRFVERIVRRQFTNLDWSRTGADVTDQATGISYDILSGTKSNIDLHARRMSDVLFRMITF